MHTTNTKLLLESLFIFSTNESTKKRPLANDFTSMSLNARLTTSLPAGNAAYLQPLCLPSRKKSHCQRKMMMKMNAQSSTDLRQKFAIVVYSVPGNVITDQ